MPQNARLFFDFSEFDQGGRNLNAVDLLHDAIAKTVDENCQNQLDSLIKRLEDPNSLSDEELRSMLKQASGEAYWLRAPVAEQT